MADLIDLDEFKAVLGVGDLYPDAQLEQVIDAATNVLLSHLSRYREYAIEAWRTSTSLIEIRTLGPHKFYVGQSVILEQFTPGQYNGTATVTEAPEPDLIIVTKNHGQTPTSDPHPLIPNALVYDAGQEGHYDDIPEVREAALAIAVDVWQSRVAPGGQLEGVDFTPTPYRMGRSLLSRVSGLIADWVDPGGMVG